MTLFGKTFASPIMPAALSGLGGICAEPMEKVALGAKEAGVPTWVGIGDETELRDVAATGVAAIKIIKPYKSIEMKARIPCAVRGFLILSGMALALSVLASCAATSEPDYSALPDPQSIISSPAVLTTDEMKKQAIADAYPANIGRFFDDEQGLNRVILSTVEDALVRYDVGIYPAEDIAPLPAGVSFPTLPLEWEQLADVNNGWETPVTHSGSTVYEVTLTLPLDGAQAHFAFPVLPGGEMNEDVTDWLPPNGGLRVTFTTD